MRRIAAALALALAALACSRDAEPAAPASDALIVVNAALGGDAGRQIERGAQLAVEQANRAGGRRFTLTTMDTKGSALVAADNLRAAIARGAVTIVSDGDGVDAVRDEAARLGVPIGIVHDGGPPAGGALFRVAPSATDLALRLREYLPGAGGSVAVLHDDGANARALLDALASAFADDRDRIAGSIAVPVGADGAEQVRQARQAGAESLLVWASPDATGRVIAAARARGWDGLIVTGPSGFDPAVRTRLASDPDALTDVVVVAGRLAGDTDPDTYGAFRTAYETRYGPSETGVKVGGRPVIDPPRWAMYSYDYVRLFAAAAGRSAVPGPALLAGMRAAAVQGANGTRRVFTASDQNAVQGDEIFFARFDGFVWRPARDDPRSASLPDVPQNR